MKRVVADTNILVSAVQFGGKPKHLVDLAADGQVDLAISEAIVAETLRVLRDKCHRTPEWLAEAEQQLNPPPACCRIPQSGAVAWRTWRRGGLRRTSGQGTG